jgi:hypothetical protein
LGRDQRDRPRRQLRLAGRLRPATSSTRACAASSCGAWC